MVIISDKVTVMIGGRRFTLASAVAVATAVAAAAVCAACTSTGVSSAPPAGPSGPGVIDVVAAESQYGQVAAQIGGMYTRVTSVMTDPNTDPHSFEISTGVARSIAAARVVVQNGLGYDGFMGRIESASPSRSRKVIVAAKLLGLPGGTANPHLWYDPATMPKVAGAIAAALAAADPAHAAYFEANVVRFRAGLQPWLSALARFRLQYPGVAVATTEPVADYMLQAAGARNLTPFSFQADIMNGVDPAPQGIAVEDQLLQKRRVRALVYNEQVTDSLTEGFVRTARSAGIPVVGVYELLPTGESYAQWMLSTVQQLQKAVGGS